MPNFLTDQFKQVLEESQKQNLETLQTEDGENKKGGKSRSLAEAAEAKKNNV